MAIIFHKTKQQELQSLSHSECSKSTQSEFGTPKKTAAGLIPVLRRMWVHPESGKKRECEGKECEKKRSVKE